MNGTQAIEYIHSYCWKGAVPGLSRTFELLDRMGNPQNRTKFVHIVGTNGKGSTAAMTASILRKAGYTTGLYTSPYIIRFHERMQVNGAEISDEELGEITQFVKPLAEAMEDHPTEFELVTAIAMEFFARKHCDIVVLEAGMGGAMDSTNVIHAPEVAVFTNIGLDHTEYLGNTLEAIAETKAGIIKEGTQVVYYPVSESVDAVYHRIAREKHVPVHPAQFDAITPKTHSLEGQTFDYRERKDLFLPLLGSHQLYNAAVAVTVADVLKGRGWRITEENLRDGLRDVRWPGRFELLRKDPVFVVDGGHNPQCMAALARNLREYLPGVPLTALTGVLADKDYVDMYRLVEPYITRFVAVTPGNPRALPAAKLAETLAQFGKPVCTCETVKEGVEKAISLTGAGEAVIAFGSLYMVGEIRDAAMEK